MQIHPKKHDGRLHKRQHLDVVDDLCYFILHDVVNVRGKVFHQAQDFAMEDKYIGLRDWKNPWHRATSSSVRREQ